MNFNIVHALCDFSGLLWLKFIWQFMRNGNLKNFAFLIILISSALYSQAYAQRDGTQSERTKNFGWSLKQFKDKENKNTKLRKNKENASKQNLSNTKNTGVTDKLENRKLADNENISDEETIYVYTDLVINDVLVIGDKGMAVTNLNPNDFLISETDSEQKIELFSVSENPSLPRSIVLIFSNLLDIHGRNKSNLEAARSLVDKLAPQDKMAIVTPDVKLILDFTNDKFLLKKTLNNLSTPDPNYHRDAGTLMAVLGEMFGEKDVRPIVIFLAEEMELYSLKSDKDFQPPQNQSRDIMIRDFGERGYGLGDLKERIAKSRATIYSVIPNVRFVGRTKEEQLKLARIKIEGWMWRVYKEQDPIRISQAVNRYQTEEANNSVMSQTAMMQVAGLSGGYAEFIEKPEDAKRVFETIFAVINNRYTIGYYSTNQTKDGKPRKVKITVRGHPEYTILHRENYLPK